MKKSDMPDESAGLTTQDRSATPPKHCPSCGSDEIETLEEARKHNQYVIARDQRIADHIDGYTEEKV